MPDDPAQGSDDHPAHRDETVNLDRVRQAYEILIVLAPATREAVIRSQFTDQPNLVAEVRLLLEGEPAAGPPGGFDPPSPGPDDDAEDEADPNEIPPGTQIGPFVIRRLLGRGGMGAVFQAERIEPYHETVALKIIDAQVSPDQRRRFEAERAILAQLRHPHIVRLLGGGSTPAGGPYLVMEYVDGQRLDTYCRDQKCAPREIARLVLIVCDAIEYAHSQEIIHRDLKPSNILVTRDGHPMVTDFGLARSFMDRTTRTMSHGLLAGTPSYVAPEQILGTPKRNLPGVDCYGLGALLYKLLCGQRPHDGGSLYEICGRTVNEDAVPVRKINPNVPRELNEIVRKALAREPEERFQTVTELSDQLRLYLADQPLTIRPPSTLTHLEKWAFRRRRELTAWGATVGLLLVTSLGLLLVANQRVRQALHSETRALARANSANEAMRKLMVETSNSAEELTEALPMGSDKSHAYFREMVDITELALAECPDDTDRRLLTDLAAKAHFRLARSLQKREADRGSPEVLAEIDREIALLRDLVRDDPAHLWHRSNLSRSLSFRCEYHAANLDEPRAIADARESLALIEDLARMDPDDLNWQDILAHRHYKVGERLFATSQTDDAEREVRLSRSIATKLIELDPTRPGFRDNLYRSLSLLALIEERRGRVDEAIAYQRELLQVNAARRAADPSNHYFASDEVVIRGNLVRLLRRTGDLRDARELQLAALELATEQAAAFPYDVDRRLWMLQAKADLAGLTFDLGEAAAAEALYQEVITALEDWAARPQPLAAALALLANLYTHCEVVTLRDPARAQVFQNQSNTTTTAP